MTGGRLKTAAGLFWYFFRIGWYTFGGGWSIVAQIEKDFVEKRGEITSGELLDIVSVGKSLPGLMIGNVAYLFGHHLAGVPGGVLAVLGICMVPFLNLGLHYLLYKCTAALAATASGNGRVTGLIEQLSTAFGLILAMTGSCGVLLVVAMISTVSTVAG